MRIKVRMKDPRYDVRDRYMAGIIPEYNDYTGTVMPNPKWLGEDYFCLSTNIPESPVRMLYKDNIICGWLNPEIENGKSEEPNVVVIPKNGKNYFVSMDDRGHLYCNCTGFGYRRTCTHVAEVMEAA